MPAVEVTWCRFVFVRNGVEEAMEEPVPEPEAEPEPEPKVEDIKPEIEEKVLEEMEEKAPSPVPVESPPNIQEPPKVKLVSFKFIISIMIPSSLIFMFPSNRTLLRCISYF